jgi:hypothetical protein
MFSINARLFRAAMPLPLGKFPTTVSSIFILSLSVNTSFPVAEFICAAHSTMN